MRIKTHYLVTVFAAASILLLVQNRANEPEVAVTTLEWNGAVEVNHQRGGTISTGADGCLLIEVGDALVELSENTDLRLDRLFEGDIRLFVQRGRVSVSVAPVTLTTDRVSATGSDFELVNYDFQERVTVEPTTGTVTVIVNDDQTETLEAYAAERLEISEIEPFTAVRMSSGTSE